MNATIAQKNISGGIFILKGRSQKSFDSLGKLRESVPQINWISPLSPTAKPKEVRAIAAGAAPKSLSFLYVIISLPKNIRIFSYDLIRRFVFYFL